MLYRQKFNTFIRSYGDAGYITNTDNGTDRVVNASGAVFLSALSREPQTLDALCKKIAASFIDVEPEMIKEDASSFFSTLASTGFIISGETEAELDSKDTRFSYASIAQENVRKNFTPVIPGAKKNAQDILKESLKTTPTLLSFQIEITSRCNERCIHCYIPHENKIRDMEPAMFYDVLGQCSDMGLLNLTLSGGEPMLHKNFGDFLRKTKEYDFSVSILSNLTLLTDEILAEMKTSRLSNVQVSLYSMNPEIHDAITKLPGSFHKTFENIHRILDADIPLQISCPTMKQNKDDYKDVMKWAHEHKCKSVTDYIMMARYNRTTDNLEHRLSLDEAGKLITDIVENDTTYQSEILSGDLGTEPDPDSNRDRSDDLVCGVCVSAMCMVANGNVFPCAGWQDNVCGNVKETSLREIWESSPRVKYLRSLRQRDFPKCLDCKDRKFCARCMVRNANENPEGDPLKINEHFCKVAELNHKIVTDWLAKKSA